MSDRFPPPSVAPSRLLQMIDNLEKPLSPWKDEFQPVMDYKKYISLLEDSGHPTDIIKKIRRKHEDYYSAQCLIPPPPSSKLPVIPDLIYTDSEVNGCTPFLDFATAKPHECIPMYREAGVTEKCIKFLEQKITKWELGIPGRNKVVDEVLSKYSGKPPARKKKKSLRSRFMRKTAGIVKDEEGDNNNEAE